MSDSDVSAFGELLQRLRSQRDISQHHLAIRLDVHRNTISKWERGICLPESKTLVLEIARQLQLDTHDTQRLLEASLTAFSPHWYMPSPRNIFFTGRDALVHYLHEKLGREQTAFLYQSCALTGLGGVGKTQAAIEYAYRYAHDYTAILWVAAETGESITASFMALANVLHLPVQDNQHNIIKAVCQWLSEHSEWLLIFDNVENLELIRPLLPAARSGAVLLTTRLQYIGDMARTIHLECMTSEEGCRFLLRRAKLLSLDSVEHSLPPQEVQAAQEIVMLMGGLPLALDQAGAYIEATQCSLQDYLQLLQSAQLYLLRERDAYADHPLSVSKTFTLSFEALERCNAQAASLLTVCAFLAPEGIPESFFYEGAAYLGAEIEALAADPFRFNAAIKALQAYSFVQRCANTRMIKVHSLVQAVLKGRLTEAIQHQWGKRVIRAMSQLFPSDEKTQVNYWQICELLLPHASVCITQGEQWDEDKISYITLLNRVAAYRAGRVQHTEAESLYMRALYLGNQVLGSAHPLVAETLQGLAFLYCKEDKYKEARSLYQQALFIREQAQEKEHPLMAEVLNGLAMLYYRQGKYWEAEPLYQRALQIWERTIGEEHPQVATLLNNLAGVYGELGKYWEAEPFYLRALRIREQALGGEHPQVATLLNNLAELYKEEGRAEEAESLYQRALHIWEQDLGPQHLRVAHPLHGLAELYRELGKYKEAEPLYQQALHIVEQTLGAEHPNIAAILHCLARFHLVQQQTREALLLYQQALTIREQTLGPCHPKTNMTREAYTCLLLGDVRS